MSKLECVTSHGQKISIEDKDDSEFLVDFISNYIIPLLLGLGYHPHSIEEYIENPNGSYYDGWEKTSDAKELENKWKSIVDDAWIKGDGS